MYVGNTKHDYTYNRSKAHPLQATNSCTVHGSTSWDKGKPFRIKQIFDKLLIFVSWYSTYFRISWKFGPSLPSYSSSAHHLLEGSMTVLWSLITYYRSQKKYMKKFAGTVWSLNTSPHARFLLTACHPNEPKTKTSLTTSTPGMTFSRLLERGRGTFSKGQKFWSRLHWLGYFCQFVVGQVVSTGP